MVDLKQVERFPSILISRNYLLFLVTMISDKGKSHLIQCRNRKKTQKSSVVHI
jgi:hypothetical protein